MKKQWRTVEDQGSSADEMSALLGIPRLLARMLLSRGLVDPQEAWSFLNPKLEHLHEPFLMLNMDRVIRRILQARQRKERILIYGDYDVDGITSTVILKKALEMTGIEVDFYLPKRLEEGYGLQKDVIRMCFDKGIRLVITADSGIRAFEVCRFARDLGLDLIVTDHHLPDQSLPNAFAILNPRQPGCNYPEKNLAAVGVVFKLVHALFQSIGRENVIPHFLKLVAIGTIADLVPLTGENRILAKFGLDGLSDARNIGLRALLQGAGVDEQQVSHFDVSFKVAPRMNAVTRMGGGREVVDLFSVDNAADAESIVREMNRANQLRREEELGILTEIEERFSKNPADFEGPFLVVAGKAWHRGVIGIVASRLVDRFYRPALVLSIDDSGCQGSGRSIPGFHLLEALEHCQDLLGRYGGHSQAVGCSFDAADPDNVIRSLKERLEAYALSRLSKEDLTPALRIEEFLRAEELNLSVYETVQRLAPFGIGNPVPLFATRQIAVTAGPWVLKDRHLKFGVQENGNRIDAIWWGRGEMAGSIREGDRLDIAYSLERNVYRGVENLTLILKDVHRP